MTVATGNVIASLAITSAFSFFVMSVCEGTHINWRFLYDLAIILCICYIISLKGFRDSRVKRVLRESLIPSILLIIIVFACIRASVVNMLASGGILYMQIE